MRILLLLLLVGLVGFSGCVDNAGTDEAPEEPAIDEPDAPSQDPAFNEAKCKGFTNYGTQVSIEGHYIITDSGDLLRIYEESNGRDGLQVEEDCPEDHDERIV